MWFSLISEGKIDINLNKEPLAGIFRYVIFFSSPKIFIKLSILFAAKKNSIFFALGIQRAVKPT